MESRCKNGAKKGKNEEEKNYQEHAIQMDGTNHNNKKKTLQFNPGKYTTELRTHIHPIQVQTLHLNTVCVKLKLH